MYSLLIIYKFLLYILYLILGIIIGRIICGESIEEKPRKEKERYSVSDDPNDYYSISNAGCFPIPYDVLEDPTCCERTTMQDLELQYLNEEARIYIAETEGIERVDSWELKEGKRFGTYGLSKEGRIGFSKWIHQRLTEEREFEQKESLKEEEKTDDW